ncbi:MAG: amidophosphoribosyltransferase [Candidatus Aminicenantes bacterium]|nr:amidophosphoribosyltransferase [Candidatus Aminicenantes bacterium]
MCGVIGLWVNDRAFPYLHQGLMGIQHRGQDSAGIVTYDGRFHTKKGNGQVRDIFREEHVDRLTGGIGIGHTRYPTVGGGRGEDAQPFQLNSPFGIIMAHNGNVVNYAELRKTLYKTHRRLLNSDNDVESILNIFAQSLEEQNVEALTPEHIFEAVRRVYRTVVGSYSVVAYIGEQGMVAFRDPFGIKPLVWSVRTGAGKPEYAFASETVSLSLMGFKEMRDVAAGQAIFIDRDRKAHVAQLADKPHSPCLFEWVYFARPDSFIDDANVYRVRIRLGQLLAEDIRRAGLHIDVVVPVPDSSRDAAIEIARSLDLPYREALVKNRYIGRTFIMPDQAKRKHSVRLKLNTIASEFKDKDILLVDDSIVRGTTSQAIVEMVRECGAKHVYFAVTSPPLRHPCVYGIDMQTRTEFLARDRNLDQIAEFLDADRVIYQTLDNLKKAVGMENPALTQFCAACFDGNYVTGDVTAEMLQQIEDERKASGASQLPLPVG